MNSILIKDIYLGGKSTDILIENNRISRVCEHIVLPPECRPDIIDGRGKAVIPGFANMHTHAAMTIMRGAKEDMSLHKWLESIWKLEEHLDDELVYWGTKLACVEMLKTGTTLFNDQYFFIESAVKAASQMGIRGAHSFVFIDLGDADKAMMQREACIKTYEESKNWGDTAIFEIGIHAAYTVCEENIIWACNFAAEHGLKVHIHIGETSQELQDCLRIHGCTPVEYLDRLGIFSPDIIAAHCIWLSDSDIQVLGRNKVNVAHNINSNLKLASGYKFKFQELVGAGVNVCLGTDGVASSNNLDIMETMKTTALVQKAWRKDPSAITLSQLIESATKNGYRAFSLEGGEIKEGMLADLSIIDIDNYSFTPNINFEANLVYSAHSDCIQTVICNGKIVMKDRYIAEEREILSQVRKLSRKLLLGQS